MSPELVSILVLIAMFVAATVAPVNMGVLALVAAFVIGTLYTDLVGEDIALLFPGDLFVLLVGITYLFAIAQSNGTIGWLVAASVRAVGGRLAVIPWVIFVVAGILTAVGAVSPAAVAILAPLALGVAARYGISQLLMGLMVVHGAQAGGFSPISIYGVIVNGVVARADLPGNDIYLFLASLVFNTLVAVVVFVVFGGLPLLRRRASAAAEGEDAEKHASAHNPRDDADADDAGDSDEPAERLTFPRALTLVGLVVLALTVVIFDLDVGFMALVVALLLTVVSPDAAREAIGGISWSVVLLVGGVLTYVSILEEIGTITYVGNTVADMGAPLVVALLLCYVGGIVSAFASSTAILGATIPLAIPFLREGSVGAVAMIAALSVSSTVVDVSPLSTNGAIVLANGVDVDRQVFFRRLLAYGAVVVAVAPVLLWLALVLPAS
jgi:Na+/H+ antiporter NhaD/arsenite permease-like protein